MRRQALTTAVLFLTALQTATASDWPGFRGPGSDNAYRGESPLSELEGFGLEVVWRQSLGSGYSSVSVASGRAVTLFSDGSADIAVAFDAATGEEAWRRPLGPTYRGHDGSHNGPISTPLIADGRVFALSPLGYFHAISLQTGEQIWTTHLGDDHGAMSPLFGFGTSPVLVDGVVVVGAGTHGGPLATRPPGTGHSFLGFEPASGEVLWRVGKDSVNYQAPVPVIVNGRPVLLAPTDFHLYGLEASSGETLWKLVHGGQIYPGPGLLSMNPVVLGGDRFLLTDTPDSSSVVELISGEAGQMNLDRTWRTRAIRGSYAVPLYHDGHLYAYSSRFLTCVDAADGGSVWRSRQPGDGFPILVDGHLVVMTKKGSLHVAEASPEGYRESGSVAVFDEGSWTPPSFANGRIYVRSLGGVAAVAPTAEPTAATAEAVKAPEGTRFANFLAELKAASDKTAVVDRFLASVGSFPLIESTFSPEGSEGREVVVHFLYRGDAHDMAIAGDMIGERSEREMPHVAGTDLFYYSIRLPRDARVSYYFIKNFEERIIDPLNSRKFAGMQGEVSWVYMPAWQAPTHLGEAPEGRQGRMESQEMETKRFEGRRRVDVYLPAGYDEQTERRYPVVYVHGGQAAAVLGGWTRTLDNLVGHTVEPLITVFIHTPDPREEFLFGQRDAYAGMFAEEIVPAIDKKYRTIGTVKSRGSAGAGLAGYAALYATFKHPGVIGRVASQSTFLITMHTRFLVQLVRTAEEQPLGIFLEWGTYDLRAEQETWDIREENRQLVDLLRSRDYGVTASEVPDGHGWASWRNRNDKVLEWLFPLSR